MPTKSPATPGMTARKGKVVLAVYSEHELLADLEFTPRQWLDFASRGNAIASEILREGEAPA